MSLAHAAAAQIAVKFHVALLFVSSVSGGTNNNALTLMVPPGFKSSQSCCGVPTLVTAVYTLTDASVHNVSVPPATE